MYRLICAALVFASVFSSSRFSRAASQDLSTPKKAAVEFARDLESGDMAAAKAASFGSSDDFKFVQVISGLVRAARDLRSAAMEKFGDAGKDVAPNGDELADFAKHVDSGIEAISGDTATVGQPNERDPMKLKKGGDGSWRVDLAAIPEKDEIVSMLPKVQKVFATGATDIRSGKYKTADEAKDAISQQMFAVISASADTRPASAPAEKQ